LVPASRLAGEREREREKGGGRGVFVDDGRLSKLRCCFPTRRHEGSAASSVATLCSLVAHFVRQQQWTRPSQRIDIFVLLVASLPPLSRVILGPCAYARALVADTRRSCLGERWENLLGGTLCYDLLNISHREPSDHPSSTTYYSLQLVGESMKRG